MIVVSLQTFVILLEVNCLHQVELLATPLSRRNFNSTTGRVIEDLADQRNTTIAVANSIGVDYIDLNEASVNYLNAIGPNASATYNLSPSDFTHLNPTGSIVFGDMLSWLLTTTTSVGMSLEAYTAPSPQVIHAIKNGKYVYPSA